MTKIDTTLTLQFIGLYPKATNGGSFADISLRRLFCEFLSASLSTVLARNEENVDDQVMRTFLARSLREADNAVTTLSVCARSRQRLSDAVTGASE